MAKFKIGDKVVVVKDDYYEELNGKTGVVTMVEEGERRPYRVTFDTPWEAFKWERFRDDEIALVEETVVASGVVSIDYTVASAVVLVGDTHVASKLREYAKNGEEIEVVVRVKRKEA